MPGSSMKSAKELLTEHWFDSKEEMLDYQVRRGMGGKMKWKDFSENLVNGCWGDDQVYYKYKTDYWR